MLLHTDDSSVMYLDYYSFIIFCVDKLQHKSSAEADTAMQAA